MATYYQQNCPLCESAAEYCLVDYGNRKYFSCPKCRQFQIAISAESPLVQLASRRSHYASLAPKALDMHLFVIRKADHETKEKTGDAFSACYVAKADLPLTCE